MRFVLVFGLLSFTGLLSVIDCTPQNVPRQNVAADTAPTMTTSGRIYQVKIGSRLEMTCSATGSPQPTLSWTRRKSNTIFTSVIKKTQSIRLRKTTKGLQLVITRISREHKGPYFCVARNTAGTARMVSYVDVQLLSPPKPPILTPLEGMIFPRDNIGDTAIFFMFMKHTPPGTAVFWDVPNPQAFKPENRFGRDQFFNTKTKLINGVQHEIHEGRAYMFLKNVTVRDSGTYRCHVVTPWGLTTTQTLNVFVESFSHRIGVSNTSSIPCVPSGKSKPAPKTPSFRIKPDDDTDFVEIAK